MKNLLTGLIALAIANNLCAQSNLPTIPIKESGFGIIGGSNFNWSSNVGTF